jgi:hypothetical protein
MIGFLKDNYKLVIGFIAGFLVPYILVIIIFYIILLLFSFLFWILPENYWLPFVHNNEGIQDRILFLICFICGIMGAKYNYKDDEL